VSFLSSLYLSESAHPSTPVRPLLLWKGLQMKSLCPAAADICMQPTANDGACWIYGGARGAKLTLSHFRRQLDWR
jgi:hypothetical protein